MKSARVALATLVFVVGGCSWSQYAGNAGHTSWNRYDTALTVDNVAGLAELWRTDLGIPPAGTIAAGPVIDHGTVFASFGVSIYGYREDGSTNCGGTPTACSPLFSASLPVAFDPWMLTQARDLAVEGKNLIALTQTTHQLGASAIGLRAYGVSMVSTCPGPAPCATIQLWSAELGSQLCCGVPDAAITTARDRIYAYSAVTRNVRVFDARGFVGCDGVPRVCAPLFETAVGAAGRPAVADRLLYVPSAEPGQSSPTEVRVYDAGGVSGCTGGVCEPLFRLAGAGAVTVAEGRAFVGGPSGLRAFDASGAECTGTPVTCQPRWSAATSGPSVPPTVADGRVYVSEYARGTAAALTVYDAAGITGCSAGDPVTCTPLWAARPDEGQRASATAHLLVAGGSALTVFDLGGRAACSGSPKTCSPLWSTSGTAVEPAVASGRIAVRTGTGLRVFGLPS